MAKWPDVPANHVLFLELPANGRHEPVDLRNCRRTVPVCREAYQNTSPLQGRPAPNCHRTTTACLWIQTERSDPTSHQRHRLRYGRENAAGQIDPVHRQHFVWAFSAVVGVKARSVVRVCQAERICGLDHGARSARQTMPWRFV